MVRADASVIAFTTDPVTGATDLVAINACHGLGDAMASGEVTPDMVHVRKSDVEPALGSARASAVLSPDQAREVARLALDLERDAGHAVDIEAAFAGGRLYLLQSRPVTAAGVRDDDFPIAWAEPGDEKIAWTREDAHFFGASHPLKVDDVRLGPGHGIQWRQASMGLPMRFRYAEFNGFIYEGTRVDATPEEMKRIGAEMPAKRRALSRRLVTEWDARYRPAVREHLEAIDRLAAQAPTTPDPAAAWDEVWKRHNAIWEIHMIVTGGAYPVMQEIHDMYAAMTGRSGIEAFAITAGRAPTLQGLQRDTFALVETARALPSIAKAIRSGVDRLDVLVDLPGGDRFGRAVETFVARHGEVGQADLDLLTPPWRDDPATLVREIRRALDAPPEDPDIRLARLLADGEATRVRVREVLRDRTDELARYDELVALAQAVGPLTEEHNYWIDRFDQAAIRRAVLAFGGRLVADGSIERAEDIVHFYVTEVAELLRAPRDARAFVLEREERHARNSRRRAPARIGAKEAPAFPMPASALRLGLGHQEAQDEDGVLKGVGASAGLARGPARLVHYHADLDRVRAGDVLVCRSSTVSYVPVYARVAAVVTEVGGALSHAAVVAREFGVPCVVATGVALTVLTDGEDIEVDGAAGIVRRVPRRVALET
jgi:pyruvate,water dikinase